MARKANPKNRASDELADSIKALLEIGNERNRLVHQDYATFTLEKDSDEIYDLYQRGLLFVENLSDALRECDDACRVKD
ncbi:hypothetical protein SBV1_1970002 [Verrucomicrobia bacterium]|nr:hypothetical protein SBV1_1970002 [Verrucomicrobiota bacterium]